MLVASLSGLFTCAVLATSFSFNAGRKPDRGALGAVRVRITKDRRSRRWPRCIVKVRGA